MGSCGEEPGGKIFRQLHSVRTAAQLLERCLAHSLHCLAPQGCNTARWVNPSMQRTAQPGRGRGSMDATLDPREVNPVETRKETPAPHMLSSNPLPQHTISESSGPQKYNSKKYVCIHPVPNAYFIDQETEAQRRGATCLRPHSKLATRLGLDLCLPTLWLLGLPA